jgi:GT2 family glycosyltransferase/glycosyltransferase involved in cell wall biosynthesis
MARHFVFMTTELHPVLPGGGGTVVAELARRLTGDGHRVTVVLVGGLAAEPTLPGVEVRLVAPADQSPSVFGGASHQAARALAELVSENRPDLVEFQDFGGLGFWALTHRAELGLEEVRLAVRFHGPMELLYERAGVPGLGAVDQVLEREGLRLADLVIAPSAPIRELVLERYGLEPGRVLIGEPPIPDIAQAPHRPSPHPEFVYFGAPSEVKGAPDFLAASLRLLDEREGARVRFVGGEGWSAAENRPMVARLEEAVPPRLRPRVSFEPRVPRHELASRLASGWAVVIPSRFESFSLAAHEVRRLGLPVVLPDLPAFRPYFSEATGAIVYDGSIEGLTDTLRMLADHPEQVRELAAAPPPEVGDPLAIYYQGHLPKPRHPRVQSGLATEAVTALDRALRVGGEPRPLRSLASGLLRALPSPLARLAIRLLPQAAKDRFRRLASWPEEEARRARERRRAFFRAAIDSPRFGELEEPEVSVVIPCYNQGRFLEDALMSVFEQTFTSFEVIVVDDGSTDPETRAVLSRLQLPRVRLLRQENQGLPAARNAGMRAARGRYLVPLDADDELTPTFLEELHRALEPHPEAAYAHCWAVLFGDQQALLVTRPYNPYQLLLSDSVVGCVLLRREAWEAVGGYDETMVGQPEDWELWLRLMKAGWGQVQVYAPLFRYRKHGVTLSVAGEVHFEKGRRELVARHPELYRAEAMRRMKREWYPWVSVLVGSRADLSSLASQTLQDLEVVVRGTPSLELEEACRRRGVAVRSSGPTTREALSTARGKFLLDWDLLEAPEPGLLERLAGALEENPKAMGAGPEGTSVPLLWRRWSLLDRDSPHAGLVEVATRTRLRPSRELERGAFPQEGWVVTEHLTSGGLPVVRQPPEEDGRLPGWVEELG